MTKRFRWWCVIAIVGIPIFLTSAATAQDQFEVWGGGEGLWTNDDNWTFGGELSGAPSLAVETGAQINSGTVIINADVDAGGILLNGGTLDIQSGSLVSDKTDFQSGVTNLNGTVRIAGGTSFTGPDVTVQSRGFIELLAPTSGFEAKGDLTLGGTLRLTITADGTPNVKVGGEAKIRGVISPVFDGISPAFGDSFEFLSAASVTLGNAVVDLPDTVVLGRGLDARIETTTTSASLTFGNLPILQLNRASGESKILNVVGGPVTMTGYTIGSELGLLNPAGLAGLSSQGAAGWEAPNPKTTAMSEINLTGETAIAVDGSISLGNAYNGGATHPNDEDVSFQFSTPDGSILDGLVEYIGPANDFVANVNPETGEVSLYHLSSHLDPIEVTGYSIFSASGSLNVEAWTSFVDSGEAGEGWIEANPQATLFSELNLEASKVFDNGTVISLGNIFKTDGLRDIKFDYTTIDALLSATVEYGEVPDIGVGCAPANALLGDLDGSGDVGFNDFLVLSANFGKDVSTYAEGDVDCNGNVAFGDFLALSANFGKSLGATASVPEPSGIFLLSLGGVLVLRRRRQSTAT